ncbi:YicC/YloC family endoribonuclease [Silanimonas sp.]|uniref:YicC/YloC family endoribonuclease n=1 Tax=Silanimonas sp. TaxID=1929290 RepID=UPI001BBD12C9|nr:YicC/YloC family endoribonuclease [Silanimonas sp.]MBS3897166.1 YicC family protein [Silanimonas sp.]MBS3923881.1 YicC family protein [Xanthomonadaceae bacterium]
MIRSMTAFAAVERATAAGTLAIELRAVNHRYLELSLRLPDELRVLEPMLREKIAAKVSRGKLDLGLRLRSSGDALRPLTVNAARLEQLADLHETFATRFPTLRSGFAELLAFPGVLAEAGTDMDALRAEAALLADALLADFLAHREREGRALAVLIEERLGAIEACIAAVRAFLPELRGAIRQRIETRFAELKLEVDPARLEQELVLLLQRADVDEELDRLATHVAEARHALRRGEAIGRRLDFLLQEFNREANTLGAKAVDARLTQVSVELKVLIEQIREQVQNIE